VVGGAWSAPPPSPPGRHDWWTGDLYLATGGDHELATSGDFLMAMDTTGRPGTKNCACLARVSGAGTCDGRPVGNNLVERSG